MSQKSQIDCFQHHLSAAAGSRSIDGVSRDQPSSADAILDALEATLIDRQDFHRLFDARLMRVRSRLGLPLTQPTSLANIPAAREAEFREAYIGVAREVGDLLLQHGRLPDAWAYFRTIGEPQPVRSAIEQIPIPEQSDATFEEILNLALYEGAHVVRGLAFLLKTHGTCNTITAMSQLMSQMNPEERRSAAAMMVNHLYGELRYSIQRDLQMREKQMCEASEDTADSAAAAAAVENAAVEQSVEQLIADREWLFADGNYHIDVSHLHATVGFARSLKRGDPELSLAIQLCLYGRQLSESLRYPADVPFDDYYAASLHFLRALAGQDENAALAYFAERLGQEPDFADRKLIAFVLMDLANRTDRMAEFLPLTAEFLGQLEDPNGFSFTAACVSTGSHDLLQQVALKNDDALAMASAMLSQQP